MANIQYSIYQIDSEALSSFRTLSSVDLNLLTSAQLTKAFDPSSNHIELSYYSLDNLRLTTAESYKSYTVLTGDNNNQPGVTEISIDVEDDYLGYGFGGEEVKAVYNFLNFPYNSEPFSQPFYVENISPDRTELRLVSLNLTTSDIVRFTDRLKEQFTQETYSPDLYLYFGQSLYFSIVNIDVEDFRDTNAVILKLYNPLPSSVNLKTKVDIVEKIANSIAYQINVSIIPEEEPVPTLRGANFNVEIEDQVTEPSGYFNYNELFSFPVNNTHRELNSLFNEKGAKLGIDYSDFKNFINFSSVEERIRNFKYKLDLIDSYQSSLDNINSTTATYSSTGISGSVSYYENLVNGVVNNFDHYENYLYFESGSNAWPKSNSIKPYINQASSTIEATTWFDNEIEEAVLYDASNPDLLANTIASFLREDNSNSPYDLFVDMIGQHFDNLWVYTDAVTQKYNADNRLEKGVSKDLVEDLLKNFGVKLYTSNKSVEDLYKYFTINNYDLSGESISGGIISSGGDKVSQNDYQKEIYKRIYHNLPLLLKSKGTERGLRALINCFGVPSDVLKIKIFGGQSASELPYFGGEQPWTGSINKVRVNNTGSIVEGDTLSFYTGITSIGNKYSQDLHRIEVGFSPADNIDSYIVSQSAVLFPSDPLNIDQYIGDPRQSTTNRYSDLFYHAKSILADVDAYNLKDFVRLIKFFDNVLFRMIRDFTPARSVTDTGIIIKPHLLDRNKIIAPTATWTRPEYSGSIKTSYTTGSNAGAYRNIGVGSRGGESGTGYERFVKTPFGIKRKYINEFNTDPQIEKLFDEAKFDGELKNSFIRISNGELNDENPFKQIDYPLVKYSVQYFTDIPSEYCIIRTGSNPNSPNNEFIISNPENNLNLATSAIFDGDTSLYSYTVDSEPPNINTFTHNFSEDLVEDGIQGIENTQYTPFEIIATHQDHPNIQNSASGSNTNESGIPQDGCKAERTARLVQCALGGGVYGIYPNLLSINTGYNLWSFFFDGSEGGLANESNPVLTNTRLTFFINGVNIGSTINGEPDPDDPLNSDEQGPPTNYVFPDSTSQLVTIEVKDSFDLSCIQRLILGFNACGLYDLSTSGQQEIEGIIFGPDPDRVQNYVLPVAFGPQSSNSSTLYYTYPFSFGGITATTDYFFQVQVRFRPQPDDQGIISDPILLNALNNDEDVLYGPVPGQIVDGVWQADFQEIQGSPDFFNSVLYTNQSPVPANFFTLTTETYPELGAQLELLGMPEVGPNNIDEGQFKRKIRFKAVNSIGCEVVSEYFDMESVPREKRKVNMVYSGNMYGGSSLGAICAIDPTDDSGNRDVYVYVTQNYNNGEPVTAFEVIHNELKIYANDNEAGPSTFTPAGSGTYGYQTDLGASLGIVNRGRRWIGEDYTGGDVNIGFNPGNWVFTPNNFSSGISGVNFNVTGEGGTYNFAVNQGLVLCGQGGGNNIQPDNPSEIIDGPGSASDTIIDSPSGTVPGGGSQNAGL